jgi:hypothetical protein
MATDFQSTLISCVEIPSTQAYRLKHSGEARGIDTHYSRGVYEIYFRLSCKLSSQLITKYLKCAEYQTALKTWSELLRALETILSHSLNEKALELTTAKNFPLHMQSHSRSSRSALGLSSDTVRHFSIKAHHATARILVSVKAEEDPYRPAEPFSALIGKYLSRFPTRLDRLEKLLKDVRVSVRTSSRHRHHTTIRIIQGLAACADGAHLRHSPRVRRFGAGPRDIQVFQESPDTSLAQIRSGYGYISLKSYFEQSKFLSASVQDMNWSN